MADAIVAVAIVLLFITAWCGEDIMEHRERMAKIRRGIDPDDREETAPHPESLD